MRSFKELSRTGKMLVTTLSHIPTSKDLKYCIYLITREEKVEEKEKVA